MNVQSSRYAIAMHTSQLKTTVARMLRQSQAHAGLDAAVKSFPAELAGRHVEGHAHTAWQQVEHMRLAAEDLVAYCSDPEYTAPVWPDGYWPQGPEPPSSEAWSESCRRLLDATEQMARIVDDPDLDLGAKVAVATKDHHHTLRSALILLDHNGYHAAQLIALRQALNIWPVS